MSEAMSYFEHEPSANPELSVIKEEQGHEGPFLNRTEEEILLPIRYIDLEVVFSADHGFNKTSKTFSPDSVMSVRYLTEQAEGKLEDSTFELIFNDAMDVIKNSGTSDIFVAHKQQLLRAGLTNNIDEISDVDQLIMESFDALEKFAPDSMKLHDRVWNESLNHRWPEDFKVAFRKLSFLTTLFRLAHKFDQPKI